jgi:hypothetical protein
MPDPDKVVPDLPDDDDGEGEEVTEEDKDDELVMAYLAGLFYSVEETVKNLLAVKEPNKKDDGEDEEDKEEDEQVGGRTIPPKFHLS